MSPSTRARYGDDQRYRLGWFLAAALAGAAFVLVQIAVGQHGTIAQAAGTKDIVAKALDDHECDDTEWHFVINQLDSDADAPAAIHVIWANGNSADVPLDKVTGGVAHYRTTANLDSTVTSATAVIYDSWSGQFNLSHGPCGATTPPSSPTPPPSTSTPPSTPPSSASSTPPTSTAPPTQSTSTPPSASTTARTTTPTASSSPPAGATSSTTSVAGASTTTSPFVPGPGETGDVLPRDAFPLQQILSGLAAAMLAAVCAMAVQVLRRRGNHS